MSKATYRILKTINGVTHFARVTIAADSDGNTCGTPDVWNREAARGLAAANAEMACSHKGYGVLAVEGSILDTSRGAVATATFLAIAQAEGRSHAFLATYEGGRWSWRRKAVPDSQ